MAKVELGKTLSDQDLSDIVAFLGSLTGKLPDNFDNTPVAIFKIHYSHWLTAPSGRSVQCWC
jgi:hypothetical protein